MNLLPRTLLVVGALTIAACAAPSVPDADSGQSDSPLAAAPPVSAPMAAFQAYHQGFERDALGWYGGETGGETGWCGFVRHRVRPDEGPPASAGRGYAVVGTGPCNPFWSDLGVPGGAPYGPGPDRVLYYDAWPSGGIVSELDVFLDPDWASLHQGTFDPAVIAEVALTLRPLVPGQVVFTRPHYLVPIEAAEESQTLEILGHRIREPGWYTFRFRTREMKGELVVTFELARNQGRSLTGERTLPAMELQGPVKVPVAAAVQGAEHGNGHLWFFDIAAGLDLPIDEHRVRPGGDR